MITVQCENFADVLEEWKLILPEHWEELALNKDKVPLDMQYEAYHTMDALGQLFFASVRDAGELIGYFVGVISPELHYKNCLSCNMDILYVRASHRKKWGGSKLISFVKKELKRRGVKRLFGASKEHFDIGPLFVRHGAILAEKTYLFWLGD